MGNTVHRYSYDGWNVIEEEIFTDQNDNDILDGDENTAQRRNFIDTGMDNHIAMEQFSSDGTATMYYFLTDKRGNIEALVDDSGTVLERYHHTVYGTETTLYNADYTVRDCETDTCYFGATHTFGWSGSTFEPETDLYWMRNRYYHPGMKRFINQDPIGIWGDANNLGNGFAYVAGMVVDHADPTGLNIEEDWTGNLSSNEPFKTQEDLVVFLGEVAQSMANAVYPGTFGPGKEAYLMYSLFSKIMGSKPRPQSRVLIKTKQRWQRWEESMGMFRHAKVEIGEININFNPAPQTDNTDTENNTDTGNGTSGEVIPGNFSVSVKEETKEYVSKIENPDGTTTYEMKNGDTITVDEKGKIVKCEGDCEGIEKGMKFKEKDYPIIGDGGTDPNDVSISQIFLMQKILRKLLSRKTPSMPPMITDNTTGPNGAVQFYRNPYYRKIDPMQRVFIYGDDGSGRKMIHRNPLAPKPALSPFTSTADRWTHSPFNPGNIDPWYE